MPNKNIKFLLTCCSLILLLIFGFQVPRLHRSFNYGKRPLKFKGDDTFWRSLDLKALEIDDSIKEKASEIQIVGDHTTVMDTEIFYRKAIPLTDSNRSEVDILLLHGAAFCSKTWEELGTLSTLAAIGHLTIAFDLPGFGNSSAAIISEKAQFLQEIINKFNLKNPVIVSPSMSGVFTLPYLVEHWDKMSGYVPVAPVGTSVIEKYLGEGSPLETVPDYVPVSLKGFLNPPLPNLSPIKVPTMVVYGQKDRGPNSALLCLLPWSKSAEIPNGRHPAYLDNPNLWHKLLFNFLHHIMEKRVEN